MMISRQALLYLSRREGFKDLATQFPPFRRLTTRFVAGEEIESAIQSIRALNSFGATASIDHLNESVKSLSEADEEQKEYQRILTRIEDTGIQSNVSVKLSQFGLELDGDAAYRNVLKVVKHAKRLGNFVRIDMEGSAHTDVTLDIFRRVRDQFDLNSVGIVVQSYLYRTEKDVEDLLKIPARIRLCKGAYSEPASVAFQDKDEVDRNFVKLMKRLISSGVYHGIATHDPRMIDATVEFMQTEGLRKSDFEFQMLYGVRRDLQRQLCSDGYNVRVYVPFGKHWYPYFMRRLAERPANVWFVLRNLFKG
jgi:proline dehydrogenase